MRARIETLKRLMDLYGVVEEMHSAELQQMSAAVHEAQQEICAQREVAQSAMCDGRAALTVGDRVGWAIAQMARETAGWKWRRLEEIRLKREELSNAARDQYVTSRLKSEQMKQVVARVANQMESEEDRKMQSASDDRFLARRRWTDARNELRSDVQIKVS